MVLQALLPAQVAPMGPWLLGHLGSEPAAGISLPLSLPFK